MPRRRAAALLSSLLLLLLALPAAAQELDLEPVGFGGRIEVPADGYALTLPEDWVHLFPTLADASALAEVTQELAPQLASALQAAVEQGVGFSLLAFGEVDAEAGFTENCNVLVTPQPELTLEEIVASETESFGQLTQLLAGPEVALIDLPAGPAARIDYALQLPGFQTAHTTYYLVSEANVYVMTCTDLERPEDGWLSIAESFEFLPLPEVAGD